MRRAKEKAGRVAPRRAAKTRGNPDLQRTGQLMELATVAAQARNLGEFLEHFSDRVARMLPAEWCGIAVTRGHDAELHGARQAASLGLDSRQILMSAQEASRGKNVQVLRLHGSAEHTARPLVIVPVRASGGEALGAICAYGVRENLPQEEEKLLQ